MNTYQVWVFLLIRCPAAQHGPHSSARLWPRVLQVRRDGALSPPGVELRPGEPIQRAAERAAAALRLRLPPPPVRLLTVDQHPADAHHAEELAIIMDGGCVDEDTFDASTCDRHGLAWTTVAELDRTAFLYALRTRLLAVDPTALLEGTPVLYEHEGE